MPPPDHQNDSQDEPIERELSQKATVVADSLNTHVSETQPSQLDGSLTNDNDGSQRDASLTSNSVETMPASSLSHSHGLGLSHDVFKPLKTFFITRPRSAGEDPTSNFKFDRAPKHNMDLTGNRKAPGMAKQQEKLAQVKTHTTPTTEDSRTERPTHRELIVTAATPVSDATVPSNAALLDNHPGRMADTIKPTLQEPTAPMSHEEVDSILTTPVNKLQPHSPRTATSFSLSPNPAPPHPEDIAGRSRGRMQNQAWNQSGSSRKSRLKRAQHAKVPVPVSTRQTEGSGMVHIDPPVQDQASPIQGTMVAEPEMAEEAGDPAHKGASNTVPEMHPCNDDATHQSVQRHGPPVDGTEQNTPSTPIVLENFANVDLSHPSVQDGPTSSFVPDSILHRVSSRGGVPRVPKIKGKPKMHASTKSFTVAGPQARPLQAPSGANVLQMLAWTLEQEKQQAASREEARRRAQEQEIFGLKAARGIMQAELQSVRKENDDLSRKLQEQKEKLGKYSLTASKLQSRIIQLSDGFNSVRDNAKLFQEQYTVLVLEDEANQVERRHLETYFDECVATSTRINNKVKNACAEAKIQIQEMGQAKVYLEKQLDEKVGLLAEERDRRLHLEKYLEGTAAKQEALTMLISEKHRIIDEKFAELLSSVTITEAENEARRRIAECLNILQTLRATEAPSLADLRKVENAVQSVSESVLGRLDELLKVSTKHSTIKEDIEMQLERHLGAIEADITSNQSLQAQVMELRASEMSLQERCATKESRISDLQSQLKAMGNKEMSLTGKLADLESELTALRTMPEKDNQASYRIRELETQNAHLLSTQDRLKAELTAEMGKARKLSEVEETLHKEINELKDHLKNGQDKIAADEAHQAEIERKFSDKLNEIRKQLSRDAENVRLTYITKFENQLHQANQKRLQAEASLETSMVEIMQLKQKLAATTEQMRSRESEIQVLKECQAATEEKLANLHRSLQHAEGQKKDHESNTTHAHWLKEQVRMKNAELQSLKTEQAAASAKIEALGMSLESASSSRRDLEAELDRQRLGFEATIEQLNNQVSKDLRDKDEELAAVRTARKESEENVEMLRKRAASVMGEYQGKTAAEIEELHRRLSEADAARKISESNLQEVRRNCEAIVKQQEEKSKMELGELQRRIKEAEETKRTDEARIIEKMHIEAEAELRRVTETSKNQRDELEQRILQVEVQNQELSSIRTTGGDRTRDVRRHLSQVHSAQFQSNDRDVRESSITLTDDKSKKPRRKVDRSSNRVIDVSRHLPATEVMFNDDLGKFESLDENGVHVLERSPEESGIPETQFESMPTMSFQQLNESMNESQAGKS